MASIEKRVSERTGKVTHRVIWYDSGRKLSKTFPSHQAAESWQEIIEAAGHDTNKAKRALLSKVSQQPTLAEVADIHLKRLTDVTVGTRQKYQRMFTNHLAETLGELPVDQITPDDIAEWIMQLIEKGRAPKTIRNIHSFLNSLMGTAIARGYRTDNPCTESRLPKNNQTAELIQFLTHAEFGLILEEIPDHHKPFVLFLVGTGLRFGEATALTKDDFHDNAGSYSVSVQKAWKTDASGKRYLGTPKTKRGRRAVGMHAELAQTVAPIVAAAAPGEPVFTMVAGGQLTSQAFYNRVWRDAVQRAQARGLRKSPRVHDLRHTFASWLLAEGVSLSTLSYLMGHESENTTRNVYAHMMPELVQASAESAGRALNKVFGQAQQAQLT